MESKSLNSKDNALLKKLFIHFQLYSIVSLQRSHGQKSFVCGNFYKYLIQIDYVLTYPSSGLMWSIAVLSASIVNTPSRLRLFSLISRFIVLLQVSSGFPTFLLPVGVHLMACLDSLLSGMRSKCPYHIHRRVLTTATTDC